MEWFVYGLLSAILAAAAAIVIKHTLFREHAMEFATIVAIINAALTAPFLFTINYSTIPFSDYALLLLNALLAGIAFFLVTKAVRHMPISVSSPLLALSPAFAAMFAFILLNERMSPHNLAGLLFIIIGVYILEHKVGISLSANIKLIFKQKYIKYILIALFLYAASGVAGRHLLAPSPYGSGMSPFHYLALVQLFIAFFFIALQGFFYGGLKDIRHGLKIAWLPVLFIAILTVGHRFMEASALSLIDGKLGLLEALKRTSAFLTTIIGGELFHERHLLRNVFATCVIIGGVLLVII